jgi:hypothetical protein
MYKDTKKKKDSKILVLQQSKYLLRILTMVCIQNY